MNRTVKRKIKGHISKRAKNSLTVVVYVKADEETGKPPRQLWETVKRLPDESDAQLRERAEKRLADLIKKQEEGENIVAERLTLAKYLGDWLDDYAKDHPASTTPITYRYLIEKHITPRIGSVLLPKLTARHVEGVYRAMRDAGLSGKSRRHVHRTLSQALKLAVRDGKVRRNVCDSVDPSLHKPTNPELHKLTPDEVRSLIAAAGNTEIAALVPLLAYSGIRVGEALGLRWSDVDFDSDEIHIRQARKRLPDPYGAPKTEQSIRTVPLTSMASNALYEQRQRQSREREAAKVPDPIHNLVFTMTDGSPLDHHRVTHRWQRVRANAGVPKARIHDLRHFAATTMADNGVPVHHTSAVLGHSNVTTTMNRYYRSNEADKRSAIDSLERALAER
jgi:integrase